MDNGRGYPRETMIQGERYRVEKVLKEDFFSVNVLYRGENGKRYVLKLSDFRFFLGFLFRPLAAVSSRREYRIYAMLADLEGVPKLGPRMGRRGFFHEYIKGRTLYEVPRGAKLPADFFDRLLGLVEELHKRRIFYGDLNKRGNIIVGEDGRPYLIDYQISLHLKKESWVFAILPERVFRALLRQDIYHVHKHKRHWQREAMSEEELRLAERTNLIRKYERVIGRGARRLKRLIYPKDSNEMIWYKWKREGRGSRGTP